MYPCTGTIDALWRYPVKSLLGESCQSLKIEARGIAGDRLYAIRDREGKFGSGKTTRRFKQIDGLFDLRAYYVDDKPVIVFPDGTERDGLHAGTNDALSQLLGQPVTITREAEISHFDTAPVHIITSTALASLRSALPGMQIDERRFRPNLLLKMPGNEPIEHTWIGRQLRIGAQVMLEITEHTERCIMPTFAQAELPHEPQLLKYLADAYDMQFGVYAKVIKEGRVEPGDTVELM